MQRRASVVVLASAWVAPALRAQTAPRPRLWRIGYLAAGPAPKPGQITAPQAMATELRGLGQLPGQHFEFIERYADNDSQRLPGLVDELLRAKVDLIVTSLTPAALAAQRATRSIPIVMAAAGDPVGTGLISSLARPGGNVTGLASLGPELAGKCLDLLRELRPTTRRVALLLSASDTFTPTLLRGLTEAANKLDLELRSTQVQSPSDYASAFAAWSTQRVDAVFVQPTLAFAPAVALALQYKLPSVSFVRGFVEAGGLLAYSPSLAERNRLAAAYIDKIMRGAVVAEMPVQQPSIFDLLVNAKTAGALGLKVPPALLARADEVLQ
jgi:putative tryptophan/tyrosine transport system substrate-binding protein